MGHLRDQIKALVKGGVGSGIVGHTTLRPVAPAPDPNAGLRDHLYQAAKFLFEEQKKYPQQEHQPLEHSTAQRQLGHALDHIKHAHEALSAGKLDQAWTHSLNAHQLASEYYQSHMTTSPEAAAHLREFRDKVGKLSKSGTHQGALTGWQTRAARGIGHSKLGVNPAAAASNEASYQQKLGRLNAQDVPARYTRGRRAELTLAAMRAKRALQVQDMAARIAHRLKLRGMTAGEAFANLPQLNKEHDVSGEARDDHGRWTAEHPHSVLRQQVGERLESYETKAGEQRQKKVIAHDYHWADSGQPVEPETVAKIQKLNIPPGYNNVRINPNFETDSLLAVGEDAKGRTVRFYSKAHSQQAAAEKFDRLREFNAELPALQQAIRRDLNASEHGKRIAARVLYLIEQTGFRVGSTADTQAEKQAYGATTLLGKHAHVKGDAVTFDFVGKKGVKQHHIIHDQLLADIIAQEKVGVGPNERLFETSDAKLRDYLHSIDGDFLVKDFRTWKATSMALELIAKRKGPAKDEATFTNWQNGVADEIFPKLGNSRIMVLGSYIDPHVWAPWRKPEWGEYVPPKLRDKVEKGRPGRIGTPSDDHEHYAYYIHPYHTDAMKRCLYAEGYVMGENDAGVTHRRCYDLLRSSGIEANDKSKLRGKVKKALECSCQDVEA